MSPLILSGSYQALNWTHDSVYPVKPTVPTQAVGVGAAVGGQTGLWGQDDNTYAPSVGSFSGGGSSAGRTAGGAWCLVTERIGGGTGNTGQGRRCPQWRPAINPATAPTIDDPAQRIMWLRVECLVDATETQASITDGCGFAILPDDGLAFSSATWPINTAGSGGFGLFKRVGLDGWRYASYSGAPALLESINLDATAGWHVADFIIRQARFNDATTPWLTFRWDGVDQFRERAFGHASLPTPQSLRANAHGWAFLYYMFPAGTGRCSVRTRLRVGAFHPDGFPQP